IELEIEHRKSELNFTVKDRGQGMTESQLSQSLLPFFTTKSGGTGLGLALCKEIVNAHKGRLKMYNREHGGLSVTLSLPNQ
ncbi:MAG: ATP-binding protein, partial [Kangiellaceae bacterium]|nr:ATP-binding protein [Kangiellaceae bacterium]